MLFLRNFTNIVLIQHEDYKNVNDLCYSKNYDVTAFLSNLFFDVRRRESQI